MMITPTSPTYRFELTVPLSPFVGYQITVPLARREPEGAYVLTRAPNGQLVKRPLPMATR